MLNVEKIRKNFPILEKKVNGKRLVYLDNAATTQKPIQVINAVSDYYKNFNANVHRGMHYLSFVSSELFENAHKKVASFINASMNEIVFTKNATESLNLLAYSFALNFLKKNDEVLISKLEHNSNLVPWQQLSIKKCFKLNFVNVTLNGQIDLNDLSKKISNKTKIVSITHCSNVLGTITPLKEIEKIVHEKNAFLIVDGAQSVPHLKVNVKKLNIDFLVFSGHKMLGPTGIGVLYGKKELLEEMQPFLFGGDMISEVFLKKSFWNSLPWKFEAGTPNIAGAIGLSKAIEFLEKIGMNNVLKHEKRLAEYCMQELSKISKARIYGPKISEKSGIVSFNIQGIHSHDIATVLNKEGIAVRAGHHCAQPLMRELNINNSVRASFYVYNSIEEINALINAIKKAIKLLG
jgi:cysteine desulfurase/selenocysteine lyase